MSEYRRRYDLRCLQIEYTQMASYSGEVLVEHDVTFDLYRQIVERTPTISARWDLWRWKRYELAALKKFRRVVVMSDKDASIAEVPHVRVIPNGVDFQRFEPAPEPVGQTVLFVGSFRHFPNVVAYRFFVNEVWPKLAARTKLRLVVIAGPDPHLYCSDPVPERVELHGFVSDVRAFYRDANLVVVPTLVSAGTNLKVLEAMAMERAVVSTSSGSAGLGLVHGESVWIADHPDAFAAAIETLLDDDTRRVTMARAARRHGLRHFSWNKLGVTQRRMWNELLTGVSIRPAVHSDLLEIDRIQNASHLASHWEPSSYFEFDARVAVSGDKVCGFLISREVAGEVEILNLAVAPECRRSGVATALIESIESSLVFLEVRESNEPARNLYWKIGFRVVGRRENYYENPVETALVMRLSRPGESATV